MSTGTTIASAFWSLLDLELPASRRSHGMRFFAGLKPLHPTSYASLLRSFARTLVESGYVPVRKDARHDPVELIAAGLEISIEQWERISRAQEPPSEELRSVLSDIALRIAAFEGLFRCRVLDDWPAMLSATAVLSEDAVEVFDRARHDISKVIASRDAHLDALLAELVVLGCTSGNARWVFSSFDEARFVRNDDDSVGGGVRAVRLAQGMALLRAERIAEALGLFDAIVNRVPGHTLALEQAARCSSILGDPSRARSYSKRASRLGRTLPRKHDVLSSGVKVARERSSPPGNGAVSLVRHGVAVMSEATQ